MAGLHVKKGDKVLIIAGKDKGKKGKVLRAFPDTNRVVVEGANMVKQHVRPTQKSPQGGIVEKPGTIDASNVQLICPQCDEAARLGAIRTEQGKRLRVCRKCQGEVDKS